jgi:hypothetical protein
MIPVQQIVSGQAIGSALSVSDSTVLAQVGIGGLTVGTVAFNAAVGSNFVLSVSSAALVTDQVVAVANVDGWRWIKAAAGISAADQAKLDKLYALAQATDLVDGNQTITPGSSKKSQYVLRAGVATADMTVTCGSTGAFTALAPNIVILAQAHDVSILNAAAGTLYTVTAGNAIEVGVYFSGGVWVLNTVNYV